jgi:archaellum component FlaC
MYNYIVKEDIEEEISRLEKLLADLTAQLPKHSIPATMLMRIDEVEEQVNNLMDLLATEKKDDTIHQ